MTNFFRSFVFAINGIFELIRLDRNFKIHLFALIVVVSAGFYFKISNNEWLIILLISALVISLEAVNTTIERVCDLITLELDPRIKTIKDIAAGAVLIVSVFAIGIGIIIFWKYL